MRTVPLLTSIIQIEFPPHVATKLVVFVESVGSGSKTTLTKKKFKIRVNVEITPTIRIQMKIYFLHPIIAKAHNQLYENV